MIMWLPSTYCIVVPTLNGAQRANPHAGRIEPPFLATRDEAIRLCARIALAIRVYSTCTRPVNPCVLRVSGSGLSQNCVACGAYFTGDKVREAVPCSLDKSVEQGPQSGPLLYVHDCL